MAMHLKRLMVIMSLFFVMKSIAQQRPYYTQYIMNNYLINPAVAGIENYWDAKLSHRLQWVGLQDAPITTYLTLQGPLHKADYNNETATTVHTDGKIQGEKVIGEIIQHLIHTRELDLP